MKTERSVVFYMEYKAKDGKFYNLDGIGLLQSKISIRYIKFSVNEKMAISEFCNEIGQRKSPADIFDKAVITSFEKRYAQSYLYFINFDAVWEAYVTVNNSDNSPYFYDENSANSDAHVYCHECIGEHTVLPDYFFLQKTIFLTIRRNIFIGNLI